jgi:hypothetical protein
LLDKTTATFFSKPTMSFNHQKRDKHIPSLKGITRTSLGNEKGVIGFEKLGLNEIPPNSRAHAMRHDGKQWSGVAEVLDAPIRKPRGNTQDVRDIITPASSMPWSQSKVQRDFLLGATQQQKLFYKRVTEVNTCLYFHFLHSLTWSKYIFLCIALFSSV